VICGFDTSGTTGEPKRIEHTLEAMMANAKAFNAAVGLGRHTRMYHCLPKTHMAGFLNTILCPTLAGGTVAFGPTFSAQTAGSFWVDFLDANANTVWITPTVAAMLLRLNRGKSRWIEGLEHVFCGTAPLPAKVRAEWLEIFHVPLQESYGTSEHMLVSVQSDEQAAAAECHVGPVLSGIEVEIRPDSDGNEEVWVNGSPTGDLGTYHQGVLTITGRIKELIKRGGVSIYPVQLEEAVRSLPGVTDVAVVGEKHNFWGQTVVVHAVGGDRDAIAEKCRAILSHWPDRIEIVEKLPRNEMGKVRKGDLKAMVAA
jgi:acyl-CoA synthetase (AMP-forming)/AMP-acid ligase II